MNNWIKYNYTRLKDYALWYYFRYYPSDNKLISKLKEKSDSDIALNVYSDIKHLLNEREIIITKIRNYLFKNKNLNYIKQKLFEKMFSKELVESILDELFLEEDTSLLNEKSLYRYIYNYKEKWKSISYIRNKFIERKEDKEIVEKVIFEVFWDSWDISWLKKEYEKIKWKYEKHKTIEKLLRKWFRYWDILNILDL